MSSDCEQKFGWDECLFLEMAHSYNVAMKAVIGPIIAITGLQIVAKNYLCTILPYQNQRHCRRPILIFEYYFFFTRELLFNN